MAEVARTTAKKEDEPPVLKQKRVRRKKGDAIVVGKGNREVCEMAVKLCCGGQCWATITEKLQRWPRTDKFCNECNVYLHPACHYWYHLYYG